MEKNLTFQASAYLQTLIGRELFRSGDSALVELVKNAYDAGAAEVIITIRGQSTREPGEIEVRDDGEGMTLSQVERLFMVAGYSQRVSKPGARGRVPTGEKGIGRFATDRLGKTLTVLTKVRGKREGLRVTIDWSQFEDRQKKFNEVSVLCESVEIPELRAQPCGTLLRITRLRDKWETNRVLSARKLLGQLLNPFEPTTDFRISLNYGPSEKGSGLLEPPTVKGADLEVHFQIASDGKVKRWKRKKDEAKSTVTQTISSAPASELKHLAGVKGRFLYFLERPPRLSTSGLSPAVRVYRDGFRVEPLGEGSVDWLGVAEKRAKRAGHAHVVPSRLFGFVGISRKRHPLLRDTTSRESLLDTSAALAFFTVLREQLAWLEDSIRIEVAEPRWEESKKEQAKNLQRARFHALSIMSAGLAHELRQPLQTIRTEAENIIDRMSQLGLSDRDIWESQKQIDADIERIDKTIQLIASIAGGNIGDSSEFDLSETVRSQSQAFGQKFATKGIKVSISATSPQKCVLNKTIVTIVLVNLVQNAIDAVVARNAESKRIAVRLSKEGSVHALEVSDTGDGIPSEIQPRLLKGFVSEKTGGMGVGLYYCNTLVKAQGGEITFTSRDEVGAKFKVTLPDQRKARRAKADSSR